MRSATAWSSPNAAPVRHSFNTVPTDIALVPLHRAYALREAGVTHVPCVIQHVADREELAPARRWTPSCGGYESRLATFDAP